jgi:hypothetical protein
MASEPPACVLMLLAPGLDDTLCIPGIGTDERGGNRFCVAGVDISRCVAERLGHPV